MNEREETPIKSLSIRFPVHMLEELRLVAKQHNRSLNGEIHTAIRDHIRMSQKEERKRD